MEFFRKDIIPNNTTIYIGGPEKLGRPTIFKVYCFGKEQREVEMFVLKGNVSFIYNNQEKLDFTYEQFKEYCLKNKETIDPFILLCYEFFACQWKLHRTCDDWRIVYPKGLEEAKKNTKEFLGKKNKNLNLLDRVIEVRDLFFP